MNGRAKTSWGYGLAVVAGLVGLDAAIWAYNQLLPWSPLAALTKDLYWNFCHHIWFILIPLLALWVWRVPRERLALVWSPKDLAFGLGVGAILALIPVGAEAFTGDLTLESHVRDRLFETLLFQLVFAAFGEELFYRGFMQGTLNHVLGRPWRIGGTRFGPALILVSLLFGMGHLLNPFHPLRGLYDVSWGWFYSSAGWALLYGFARERTASLIAPVLLHAAANVYPVYFAHHTVGGYAGSVARGLAIFAIVWWLVNNEKQPTSAHAAQASLEL